MFVQLDRGWFPLTLFPCLSLSLGLPRIRTENTDSSFYASIGLGTPPTSYNVIIDTGSSDLWVAGRTCETGCDGVPQYDGANSSTFESLSIPVSKLSNHDKQYDLMLITD